MGLFAALYLWLGGVIGSEFLPHLDGGAIWVRGTLAPSTGPTEGTLLMNRARLTLAAFPEVTVVTSQVGRPEDGTDTTGFFNTEYSWTRSRRSSGVPYFNRTRKS
jgi:heavy metal efflux system protein